MKKKILLYFSLFTVLLSYSLVSLAQDNIISRIEKDAPGQGKVRIYQDPAIANLIGRELSVGTGKQGTFKTIGYRVQVYSGSNSRESRAEANRLASSVKQYLPDIKVYTAFENPRWTCKVGDFRTVEEADAVMRELKKTGVFKELTIVKGEQVTITL